MRRSRFTGMALTIVFSTGVWTAFADNPTVIDTVHGPVIAPIAAEEAAQTGIINILPGLVANNNPHAQELGFASASEVGDGSNLVFSTPFAVYFVSRSALRHYTGPIPPESLLGLVSKFIYPIKVGENSQVIQSSLTVTKHPAQRNWQVTSVGSAMLIKRLTKFGTGDKNFVVWIPSLSRFYLGSISNKQIFMIKAIANDQVGLTAPLTLTAGQETPAATVFAKLAEEANMQDKGAR